MIRKISESGCLVSKIISCQTQIRLTQVTYVSYGNVTYDYSILKTLGVVLPDENIDHQDIRKALSRLLNSSQLKSSPALQKILEYVVSRELEGKGNSIKAFSIGIDALDKPDSFDPQIDPSVRVNFGRLRQNIFAYYQEEGKNDPVKIEVPKGTYRPVFSANLYTENYATDSEITHEVPASSNLFFKALLVAMAGLLVFVVYYVLNNKSSNETANRSINLLIGEMKRGSLISKERAQLDGYIQEFRISLSRNKALKVVSSPVDAQGNDYLINMTVREQELKQRLLVELINAHTNSIVWGRAYDLEAGEAAVVSKVTGELYAQIFGESQKLLEGRDPETLTARQLFVMSTWFSGPSKNSLSWEKERLMLARLALKKDPDFGPAYSVMADKLAYLASVDGPSDTKEADEEAAYSRKRAIELSPNDVNTVFNVAQSYWHSGHLSDAIRTMNRVLEIDPNNSVARFFSIVIPYTCTTATDDVLAKAIAFDAALDKDNPIRWVTLTWLGWLHLNRREFELALEAETQSAQIFQIPYTVMRHAAVLVQLDQIDKAARLLEDQKENWPNISPRHFSDRTIPKLCMDGIISPDMQMFYDDLTKAVK